MFQPVKIIAAAFIAFACVASFAQTEPWPTKPVKIISPYPPGGSADLLARQVATRLSARLNVPFLVENRPGAGGNIATDYVAKSAADGATLLLGVAGPMAINPALYKKMPAVPAKDLTAVSFLASEPFVLLANPASKIHSVAELLTALKGKPGDTSYASGGSGSSTHLAAELFRSATGTQMVHIPYKGGVPAMTDLLGGTVPIMFNTLSAVSYVNAGKLNALAVTSAARSPLLPNVPTLQESGIKGADSSIWYGIFAPSAVPKAMVTRINAEIQAVMQDADLRATMKDLGLTYAARSPDEFQQFVRDETQRWGATVQATGASAD